MRRFLAASAVTIAVLLGVPDVAAQRLDPIAYTIQIPAPGTQLTSPLAETATRRHESQIQLPAGWTHDLSDQTETQKRNLALWLGPTKR